MSTVDGFSFPHGFNALPTVVKDLETIDLISWRPQKIPMKKGKPGSAGATLAGSDASIGLRIRVGVGFGASGGVVSRL